MKNAYLTLLFLALATFSFGQFNATYTATNINGPFDNGEVVEVDWAFANATAQYVIAKAAFEFRQGSLLISSVDLGSNFVASGGVESGTFTFTHGSGCDIPTGDYTLNLVVSYSHNFAMVTLF